ncbi:hypothetical protein SH528x_002603 [Novipirellula sp. SH528]|uniref:hypothetical protein n=1 Tax=Novipirellula sp. SH528 TaxID=3454466 RepID=UPI003F9EDD49
MTESASIPSTRHLAVRAFCAVVAIQCLMVDSASAQLSYERTPIEYSTTASNDPVARLLTRLSAEKQSLSNDEKYGYLPALLRELDVPVDSQTLVFSKTSLQRHLISPSNARAIYFNDETYIAWVPGGEVIEIASTDPMLGTVFYTVAQGQTNTTGKLIRHNDRCLFCHGSTDTGRVPGLIMQSVYTNADGDRVFPSRSIPTDPRGPLAGRWAGWYVTGTHAAQSHLGNLMLSSGDEVQPKESINTGNIVDLSPWLDVSKYLIPDSDLIALMVLQHQVSMHNRLTEINHKTRLYQSDVKTIHDANDNAPSRPPDDRESDEDAFVFSQLAERLVDGLLMVDEPLLSDKISGTSSFTKSFQTRGPTDLQGRSLRQFDLRTRLFKYRCSYLIYGDSFDAIPDPVRTRALQRLRTILSQDSPEAKYSSMSREERTAILQILDATKPEFRL